MNQFSPSVYEQQQCVFEGNSGTIYVRGHQCSASVQQHSVLMPPGSHIETTPPHQKSCRFYRLKLNQCSERVSAIFIHLPLQLEAEFFGPESEAISHLLPCTPETLFWFCAPRAERGHVALRQTSPALRYTLCKSACGTSTFHRFKTYLNSARVIGTTKKKNPTSLDLPFSRRTLQMYTRL